MALDFRSVPEHMLKNVTRNQKIAIGAGLLIVIVAILVIIGIASCQEERKEVATGSDALGKALEQLASANEELSAGTFGERIYTRNGV